MIPNEHVNQLVEALNHFHEHLVKAYLTVGEYLDVCNDGLEKELKNKFNALSTWVNSGLCEWKQSLLSSLINKEISAEHFSSILNSISIIEQILFLTGVFTIETKLTPYKCDQVLTMILELPNYLESVMYLNEIPDKEVIHECN